jgi:hypothetical protein
MIGSSWTDANFLGVQKFKLQNLRSDQFLNRRKVAVRYIDRQGIPRKETKPPIVLEFAPHMQPING